MGSLYDVGSPRERRAGAVTRLVDTTMLYAPRSGGVKRYLSAKKAWMAVNRPQVRHSLVVPGSADGYDGAGEWSIYAAPLPFGDGYRWPASKTAWMSRLIRQRPSLIEAGDPYTPGLAALRAGERLGVPVIGFCHTDLAALAALHFGEWAEKPVRRRWAKIYNQFDRVVAPSRYIAQRLAEAGVEGAMALPLGVDVQQFHPGRADREALRRRLGVGADRRLLVFAGRPAREKKIEVLVEAVRRLGDPYTLVLVGAGVGEAAPPSNVVCLPYEGDAGALARLLASCDAFVHANDAEPFGLITLEAMACGLPVVAPGTGGLAETVDQAVGQTAARSAPESFAEAIEALFARDVLSLGRAARTRAVSRHSWDFVFERLMGIYAEVSGDGAFVQSAGRWLQSAAQ
ncbi:glycosyltransferase family 4 protein [Phenylobacterium montanum]|uniref:glycosyltransferase family 4 protein n=1 Tax=Phenylobacterium montanum TaxID=2823693 RepID=UPI002010E05F|nr:glycosyltransferase family 1 protein [Caulobacter sp. S6]